MFVEVPVILAWAESSVLFLDKKERGGLGGVGGADLSGAKVFVKEFFGGKAFVRGERVKFSHFRGEGVGEVDLVVIRLRGRDMVGGLLGEYRGELRVFGGKDSFGFGCFRSSGEFCGGGEAGDDRRSHGDEAGTASYDSVEGSVFAGPVDVGRLFFPLVEFEEAGVCDGIYV